MAIELTKTQRDSVEYEAGDLLVKGVPGSGKSVVLMQRALRFNLKAIAAKETKRIVILTYAKSLVKYTNELVDLAQLSQRMIDIMTIDKCCHAVYSQMTHKYKLFILQDYEKKAEYVDKAIQKHLDKNKKHRFHDIDASFWIDEFKWMKEKNITSEAQYVNAERTGRGGKVRMTKEDKAVAYGIFHEYCTLLRQKNVLEWEDLYAYVIANADKIPESAKFDYVLVDEAQDLSYVKLKVAKLLARKSITIAADKAQKIYNTSFSWKELGIDIRGKASKSLDKTFRSTKQIIQLAESLLEVNRALQDDQSEFTDAVLPEREGPVPQVIGCKNAAAEQQMVISLIKKHLANKDVIGVLYRSTRERSTIVKWLQAAGIPFEMIQKDVGWSLNTPGVKISTIHSSKGLEFDVIIIPRFTQEVFPLSNLLENADQEQISEIKAQERSLLYVGMTRAKYDLYLTYSGTPSDYLADFEPEFYKYISNEGRLLVKPKRMFVSKKAEDTQPKKPAPTIFDKKPVDNSPPKVRNGSKVFAHTVDNAKPRVFVINTHSYPIQAAFLGKMVGDTVTLMKDTFVIDKIN